MSSICANTTGRVTDPKDIDDSLISASFIYGFIGLTLMAFFSIVNAVYLRRGLRHFHPLLGAYYIFKEDSDTSMNTEEHDVNVHELVPSPSRRYGSSGIYGFLLDMCSWPMDTIRVTDTQLLEVTRGLDAVLYVTFQRHVIALLSIISCLSLVVVIPLNVTGGIGLSGFSRTTFGNVAPNADRVWGHTILIVFFALLCSYTAFCFRCSVNRLRHLYGSRLPGLPKQTVLIEGLPRSTSSLNGATLIHELISRVLPATRVTDIQITVDLYPLKRIAKRLANARDNLEYYEALHLKKRGERPLTRIGFFGCSGEHVDAINFYKNEVARISAQLDTEASADRPCLGYAFITLEDDEDADQFILDLPRAIHCRLSALDCVSDNLQSCNWSLSRAPKPADIRWESLSVSKPIRFVKSMWLYIILLIIVLFWTTPVAFLSSLEDLARTKAFSDFISSGASSNSFLTKFLPTILLALLSICFPKIVEELSKFIPYFTLSAMNSAVTRNTFIFMILQLLIMPALLMTSATAWAEYVVSQEHSVLNQFGCIFMPGNGAFFVQFLLITIFFSNTADLYRIPEAILYLFRILFARTARQLRAATQKTLKPFPYGPKYAHMMALLGIIMTFSVMDPIVAIIGFFYFCLKHLVDKHNIYFASHTEVEDRGGVTDTVINCLIAVACIALLAVTGYFILKLGMDDARTILVVATCVFLGLAVLLEFFGILSIWTTDRFNIFRTSKHDQYIEDDEQTILVRKRDIEKSISDPDKPVYGVFIPPLLLELRSMRARQSLHN